MQSRGLGAAAHGPLRAEKIPRALTSRACDLRRLGAVCGAGYTITPSKQQGEPDVPPSRTLSPAFPQRMLTREKRTEVQGRTGAEARARAAAQLAARPKKSTRGTPSIPLIQHAAMLHYWIQHLPSQRFRVLFTLFSEFCLTFPTRYFFAIGLPVIFSFRRSSPPI